MEKSLSIPYSRLWLAVLLLLAAALRLLGITQVPPGLTHDEAVHGLSAWGVVNGVRPLYFAVANGREPLYDYATAILMSFMGPTYLAPRLTSVFFSLVLIAATYTLIRKLFNTRIALLTVAGLSFGFWPVMIARHALRTITMPVFLVLGIYWWLRAGEQFAVDSDQLPVTSKKNSVNSQQYPQPKQRTTSFLSFILHPSSFISGLLLGLGFYTYIPARAMWLLLPLMLGVWFVWWREKFQEMWKPTLIALGTMLVVAAPLLIFLQLNPGAEDRIGELASPLTEARNGNFGPLGANALTGLRMLIAQGDSAWRYNLPGRPLMQPFVSALFWIGLIFIWLKPKKQLTENSQQLTVNRKTGPPLVVMWLLLGMLPVLITGSFLGSTQAIAIQPIIYLFPAVFIDWLWQRSTNQRPIPLVVVVCLFGYIGLDTVQSYFVTWGQAPEVRLQYEHTLTEMTDYVNINSVKDVLFLVDEPGRYHDQAVGQLTLTGADTVARWGTSGALLYHPTESWTVLTSPDRFSPELLALIGADPETVTLSTLTESDIDQPILKFEIDGAETHERLNGALESGEPVRETLQFGDVVQFAGSAVEHDQDENRVNIVTRWEIIGETDRDLVMFMQALGPDGRVIEQDDRLSAPADGWQIGDYLVQQHIIPLPEESTTVELTLITGFYDPTAPELEQRLSLMRNDRPDGDFLILPPN